MKDHKDITHCNIVYDTKCRIKLILKPEAPGFLKLLLSEKLVCVCVCMYV